MDTENYLQIMIDSLVQKEELLKQIVDYNEKQQAIITAAELDDQAFEQNLSDKGELVEEILKLDEGFNSVFNRVKDEVQHNKAKFKQPLQRLKELVSAVTDLGTPAGVKPERPSVWPFSICAAASAAVMRLIISLNELFD